MLKGFLYIVFLSISFFFVSNVFAFSATPSKLYFGNHHYQNESFHSFRVSANEFVGGTVELVPFGDLAQNIHLAQSLFSLADADDAIIQVKYKIDPKGLELGKSYTGGVSIRGKAQRGGNSIALQLKHNTEITIVDSIQKDFLLRMGNIQKNGKDYSFDVFLDNK